MTKTTKTNVIIYLLALLFALAYPFAAHSQDSGLPETIVDDTSKWQPSEWIGKYVMIQPIQKLVDGVRTGEQVENRYVFKTLDLIMKNRSSQIGMAGAPNSRSNFYVGDFDKHCTPNGTKLFLLLQELKAPLDDSKHEFPVIRNAVAGWDFITIEWRDFFKFKDFEEKLKNIFVDAGFVPKETNK